MASGTAAGVREQFTGVSSKTVITWSKKQSTFPSGCAGASSASGSASPNGTLGESGRCWHQVLHRALANSWAPVAAKEEVVCEVVGNFGGCAPGVGGQPDPPNDSRTSMYARLPCVAMH
jgi:hypothetical protein